MLVTVAREMRLELSNRCQMVELKKWPWLSKRRKRISCEYVRMRLHSQLDAYSLEKSYMSKSGSGKNKDAKCVWVSMRERRMMSTALGVDGKLKLSVCHDVERMQSVLVQRVRLIATVLYSSFQQLLTTDRLGRCTTPLWQLFDQVESHSGSDKKCARDYHSTQSICDSRSVHCVERVRCRRVRTKEHYPLCAIGPIGTSSSSDPFDCLYNSSADIYRAYFYSQDRAFSDIRRIWSRGEPRSA